MRSVKHNIYILLKLITFAQQGTKLTWQTWSLVIFTLMDSTDPLSVPTTI